MNSEQNRNQPTGKVKYFFNSKQSQDLETRNYPYTQNKKYYFQLICYKEQMMVSDFILLWEYGYLKEKLNIQGYIQFRNIFCEFCKTQKSKQTILNRCIIEKKEKQFSLSSDFTLNINYKTILEQYDELLPKIQQFIDVEKGKDLPIILNSAFEIYSKICANFQNCSNDNMIICIQKRFLIKEHLKYNNQNDGKYISYFTEITEKLKELNYLKELKDKNYQSIQIFDLLVEADAETLEQVYNYVKNQTALQFQFQVEEQRIINDIELNNYFLASIQITEQILQDQSIVEQFLKLEDKNQYIQNKFNEVLKNLENYQITFGDTINNQDKRFIQFKEEFINQLKIKYWIFEKELTLYSQDDQLNKDINKIFNRYSKSICLKLPFKQPFQELIEIIIDNDKMEGIVDRILDLKIQTINKCVLDHIEQYNIPDIDKKLEYLYQKKKQKYLIQLKNNPILLQQVDIVIAYCNKISTMITIENSKALVDFTNGNQVHILQSQLSIVIPNYEYLRTNEQFLPELFKETNKFCPDLSILKSTQFHVYQQKLSLKTPKQVTQIEGGKQQDIGKIQLKFLNYEKLDIQQVLSQYKDFDELPSLLYENRIWDQHQKSLISECVKCLDEQAQQKRNQRLKEQKKKLQEKYEQDFLIPFEWVETIFLKSYDESKEEDVMKKIDSFFVKVKEADQNQLKALKPYGDIDDKMIINRKQQIREYFYSLDKKNYQSMEELKENVRIEITRNREQQFKQFYELKYLIDQIQEEYLKQCREIFKLPPTHFDIFKVDRQTQQNDRMDINNKILSFYNEQLLNHLRQQLEQ